MMAKIEDVITKTLISAQPIVASAVHAYVPHDGNCFGNLATHFNNLT